MLKKYFDAINEANVKEWKIYNFETGYNDTLQKTWKEFIHSDESKEYDAFKIETALNIFSGNDYYESNNYHAIDFICINGQNYGNTYSTISMTELANLN